MRRSRLPSVARQLLKEVPDADLLQRYVVMKSDDAFAQLVARYSRLVWGQCRNLLANDDDADDAFQATFLTLARSVRKLKLGAPLGPWLHGVAFRVCKNAQRANARRTKRENASALSEASRPVADSTWESAYAAVAEEVQKLPEAQRAAFVLCCLEGRATTEAAAMLGQKLGTFSARLSRAKQTLLDRLALRGISAGVLALGGVTGSVAVAPAALIERTLTLIPSGVVVPSSIQGLTQGVSGMALIRFKVLAAGVLVAAGLSLSVGSGWYSSATAQYVREDIAQKGKEAKADPNIEKLRADLEKAKADLQNAEAELAKKQMMREKLGLHVLGEETFKVELSLDLPTKYEYEPVPKSGFSPEELEGKLAKREKAGWAFVGEVTMRGGKELVFRKAPAGSRTYRLTSDGGDGGVTRFTPAAPPVPPKPITPDVKAPVPPKPPGTMKDVPKLEFDTVNDKVVEDQAKRIAVLERFIEQLKATKGEVKYDYQSVVIGKPELGNWDPKRLAEVLVKILADEKTGQVKVDVEIEIDNDGLVLKGNKEGVAAVISWIKKLKK